MEKPSNQFQSLGGMNSTTNTCTYYINRDHFVAKDMTSLQHHYLTMLGNHIIVLEI